MLATSWYPIEYRETAPRLMKRERIAQGTPKYIAECLGTTLARGHDRITIDRLSPWAAQQLSMALDDPVLYIQNKILSVDGHTIEVGVYHMIPGVEIDYDYELFHEE